MGVSASASISNKHENKFEVPGYSNVDSADSNYMSFNSSNGKIFIKTKNTKKIYVNNEKCICCSQIKKDVENDPELEKLYDRYCK